MCADHEEVEQLEWLIVKDLQREVRTQKERLHQNHRVRNMLDSIMLTSSRLVSHTHTEEERKESVLFLTSSFSARVISCLSFLREVLPRRSLCLGFLFSFPILFIIVHHLLASFLHVPLADGYMRR